jgi:AcrR family transcriptional regulator
MSPRPHSSADLILRTTIDLVADHGVTGLSVDAVAAAAGVSKPTIYRRWRSRSELIQAAFSYVQRTSVEPDTGSLREDLVILLKDLVDYFNQPDFGRAYPSFLEAAARDPELASLRRQGMHATYAAFHRVIRRGMERGEMPEGIDIRLFAQLLVSPFVCQRLIDNARVSEQDIAPVIDFLLVAFSQPAT